MKSDLFSASVRETNVSYHSIDYNNKLLAHVVYSKVSILRPGRSKLLEFEKKIVLVVL